MPGLNIPLLHPDNNLAAWLDRKLMMGHLYEGVRDPEGVLSTFPAIVNALAGVTVGQWLHELRGKPQAFLRRSVMVGIACFVAGELWGIVFPINKKLWTSSYVLLTVGIAMLALAFCYWLFDVRHWKAVWSTPAIVFGKNAIVAYFFSEIVASALWAYRVMWQGAGRTFQNAIYVSLFQWIQPPQFASLVYSLAYIALCYAVVWWLDRRGIYLRV
ncbi:MAG TPA: hypothetical protein VF742_06380 [Terracidiphilus sp.]